MQQQKQVLKWSYKLFIKLNIFVSLTKSYSQLQSIIIISSRYSCFFTFLLFFTVGGIIPVFLTILLYRCTSILTVLYFVKDYSSKTQTKHMGSVLSPFFIHFVTALKLPYFTKLRRASIEVQQYRSIVRNDGND